MPVIECEDETLAPVASPPRDKAIGPQRPTNQPISESSSTVRPWIRFWARVIDYQCFGWVLIPVVFIAAQLAPQFTRSVFGSVHRDEFMVWSSLFITMFWVPVESMLLSSVGTTPGKWLLNVKISRHGTAIPFESALRRSLSVWYRGLGLGLPLVSLCTLCFARDKLQKNGITSWDKDEGFTVEHDTIGVTRGAVAILFLASMLLLQSAMK